MIYDLKNGYKAEIATKRLKKLIDKKALIEIKEIRVNRSVDANRLYWLWLNCIFKETGMDSEELHILYRCRFLQKPSEDILKYIKPDLWYEIQKHIFDFQYFAGLGLLIDVISRKSSKLDNKEFSEYLTKIKNHAKASFDVILLTLKDKNFEDFYREYGFR